MSLWMDSFARDLCSIDHYYGVNPQANPQVQWRQAACILCYMAMPVPRQWWEEALRLGCKPRRDFISILHDSYRELQHLPELAGKIDYASLLAIAFIEDIPGPAVTYVEWPPEKYLLKAKEILSRRSELRALGETVGRAVAATNWRANPPYGLVRDEDRLYYGDNFGAYVLQLEPSPEAWEKSRTDTEWRRTRDVPLYLRHLTIGRLHQQPKMDSSDLHCGLLCWEADHSDSEFAYLPAWTDSTPLEAWQDSNDWVSPLEDFLSSLPAELLATLKQFSVESWQLIEACYRLKGFEDLLRSNPPLAVCIALRFRVGGKPGVRRKKIDYDSLLGKRQREIAAAIGFQDSEAAVNILKKVVPDACRPRELKALATLMADPLVMPHLQGAQVISGPALSLIEFEQFRGKAGAGFITEASQEFPLWDDVTTVAEGRELLRGGGRQKQYSALFCDLRDLVRFNPDILVKSLGDFQARHAAMIKKLNSGFLGATSVRFPDPPFPGTDHIQPVTTAQELALEGKTMQHCVKSYFHDIFKGLAAVYRVTAPERATMSLEMGQKGWRLGQLKLQGNAEPSRDTVAIVNAWLKSNKVGTGKSR